MKGKDFLALNVGLNLVGGIIAGLLDIAITGGVNLRPNFSPSVFLYIIFKQISLGKVRYSVPLPPLIVLPHRPVGPF